MCGGTFFKVGGTSESQKNYRRFLYFELATVMSQALKCDVITYTPYEGLNYTILDKIKPLWKRIGEPPEIKIGCYMVDPGQQRHSGSSYGLLWLNKTVRRLRHWNFHLLSFWLALLFCYSYVIMRISLVSFSIFNTIRHRAIITPVSPLRTRLIGASTQISGSSSAHQNFLASVSSEFSDLTPCPHAQSNILRIKYAQKNED